MKEKLSYMKGQVGKKVTTYLKNNEEQLVKAQTAVCMLPLMTTQVLAAGAGQGAVQGQDIFTRAAELMNTIYSYIAGISTVTAGCVAAVCLYLMFFSKNQNTVDSSIQWLKRILVCWLAIMLMSTILYFVVNNLGINSNPENLW